jgi:hypothetical protein
MTYTGSGRVAERAASGWSCLIVAQKPGWVVLATDWAGLLAISSLVCARRDGNATRRKKTGGGSLFAPGCFGIAWRIPGCCDARLAAADGVPKCSPIWQAGQGRAGWEKKREKKKIEMHQTQLSGLGRSCSLCVPPQTLRGTHVKELLGAKTRATGTLWRAYKPRAGRFRKGQGAAG